MARKSALVAAALLLSAGFGATAQAQSNNSQAQANKSQSQDTNSQDLKLYVFSSGALTLGKGAIQNTAPMTPPIQVPVGFFVIKHPKGNVLFDTGNNDKIVTDPSYWGGSFTALKPVNTADVVIETQLQKIGLKPDDIKYVVVSHMHLDHGGNVGKVPELDHRRAEIRDPERVLAGTRNRRPVHDRRCHAAALAEHRHAERVQDDPARRRSGHFR